MLEENTKFERYLKQHRFLQTNNINSMESLTVLYAEMQNRHEENLKKRRRLQYKMRTGGESETLQAELSELSRKIREEAFCIRMCRQMEIPYERFPKDIRKLHDAISANYRVRQDKIRSQAFDQKCAEYKEVGITSDQYFIRFPHDFAELIMEGSTMHHCVASYADRVIDGTSIIFFMRKANEAEMPYITMEFDRKGELVQARKNRNAPIGNSEESAFIRKFQKEVLLPVIRSRKGA